MFRETLRRREAVGITGQEVMEKHAIAVRRDVVRGPAGGMVLTVGMPGPYPAWMLRAEMNDVHITIVRHSSLKVSEPDRVAGFDILDVPDSGPAAIIIAPGRIPVFTVPQPRNLNT